MPENRNSHLAGLRQQLKTLKVCLGRTRSKQVRSAGARETSRTLVATYFSTARPLFSSAGLDDETLGGLDSWMQQLLILAQKAALRSTYNDTAKAIEHEFNGVELALVTASPVVSGSRTLNLDGREIRIAKTLSDLVPSAGLSYEQACRDLRDENRRSYRGVAAELRESLREVLDQLAPDKEVTAQSGFRLVKDQNGPTMQQKVRFILKSRGMNKSQSSTAESAVNVVDERVGALARSVYTRSSVSTHVGTSKQEVQQVKAYVDVVLAELLEIV